MGNWALTSNDAGWYNTAAGFGALWYNTTGNANTAYGGGALSCNTTGASNVAVGQDALYFNMTGSDNIAIGSSAGAGCETGSHNIYIGDYGADESNTIRIGNYLHTNTFIKGISGVTVPAGVPVLIDTYGHLGTMTSSQRFKRDIKPVKLS